MTEQTASVVIVGAGGTIGSHLVAHIARLPHVRRLVLIDPGVYEEKNLVSQDIRRSAVGRNKARVSSRRAAEIRSALEIETIPLPVEAIALGSLRATVLAACLDSLGARQTVNEAAWRLGIPWVDAGVHADGSLVRVNTYEPGEDNPCLECAWDRRQYTQLGQKRPCEHDPAEAPPTGATSALGALAASLQALEIGKILEAGSGGRLVGRQVVVDAENNSLRVTSFRRNPRCQRDDHAPWPILPLERSPRELNLAELFSIDGGTYDRLAVAGSPFVLCLVCPECGKRRKVDRLARTLRGAPRRCRPCKRDLVAIGDDVVDWLVEKSLDRRLASLPIDRLGFDIGDVLTLRGDDGDVHYEITGA